MAPGDGNAAGDGNALGAGAPSCGGGRFGGGGIVCVAHVATCGWPRGGSKFKLKTRALPSCRNSDRFKARNGGDPWWRGGPFSGILAKFLAVALGGGPVAALALVAFSSCNCAKSLSCDCRRFIAISAVSIGGSIGASMIVGNPMSLENVF